MAKQPGQELKVAMSPRFILQTRGVYKNVRRYESNKPAFNNSAIDNLNISSNSIGQIIDASLQTIYKNIETSKHIELVNSSTGIGDANARMDLLRARESSAESGEGRKRTSRANSKEPKKGTP